MFKIVILNGFTDLFSLKFVERKDDDGNFVAADSGERCLGFCEDYKPDDKIYKVQGKLYISSQTGAENFEELKKHNITHILNVGSGIRNAYPQVRGYLAGSGDYCYLYKFHCFFFKVFCITVSRYQYTILKWCA